MDDLTQREFTAELEELIEQLFAATEDLRHQEFSGSRQRDLLGKTFRCLHSIKGLGAAAGFDAVADLAHQTENVLDAARSGQIKISTAFIDVLEDVANALSERLSPAVNERNEAVDGLLVQRLLALAAGALPPAGGRDVSDLPIEIADSLNEREKQLLAGSLRADARLCLVAANFDVATFDTEFQKLREILALHGEVVCTLPSATDEAPNRIAFRLFFTSELSAFEVQNHLASISEVVVTALSFPVPIASNLREDQQVSRAASVSAPSPTASFIRLPLAELDRLRASAHEVFEHIVSALDFVSTRLTGDARTELVNLDEQVRQSLAVLEEKIVELRTISLNRVLQRAMLAGRVTARTAGKEVEFGVASNDLRIDKEIGDAIAVSLLHMVRNAVDHGIETAEERISAGKKSTGSVCIAASATNDELRFVVSDDGRGIDPQVISLAAAARGLIEKDTVLSMEQSLRLIFRPGFSTTETVSSLSGRGVGLDVVEQSVKQVGGSVSVQSWPGKGSEFELRLPRNLAKS